MKFLDTKAITDKEGGISIIFKPVSPIDQAALLGYQNAINLAVSVADQGRAAKAKFQSVCYALTDMISTLTIDDKKHDPSVVAACADISDPETIDSLNIIYNMTMGLLVQGETKKKSSKPRKSTKPGKGARGARGQKAV